MITGKLASVKALPTSVILVATAIIQALGRYKWTGDSMVVSGQIFFPILFALMAFYLVFRNPETGSRFSNAHIVLLGLGVILLVATLAGTVASIFWLYPQVFIYYTAFLLLVIELGLRIAALPKKTPSEKPRKVSKREQRRNRGSNLVASVKSADKTETK